MSKKANHNTSFVPKSSQVATSCFLAVRVCLQLIVKFNQFCELFEKDLGVSKYDIWQNLWIVVKDIQAGEVF